MPRALAPEADRAIMAAAATLSDPFARAGIQLLRATGMRIGELLDLELDCVIDFEAHGRWLRVPLGELNTERTVPLDDDSVAVLDDWIAHRRNQRNVPHPRHGRPADFVFVEHGRRLGRHRIRRGLHDAAVAAGLHRPDGTLLHVTPHQLRHSFGTSLDNGGSSLPALMTQMVVMAAYQSHSPALGGRETGRSAGAVRIDALEVPLEVLGDGLVAGLFGCPAPGGGVVA